MGSIEQRSPGTILRLMRIRADLNRKKNTRRPSGYLLGRLTQELIAQLKSLPNFSSDERLHKVILEFISATETQFLSFTNAKHISAGDFFGKVRKLNSSLWELTIACLFNGDEIFINQTVSNIYRSELNVTTKGKILLNNGHTLSDRELDIVVRSGDRWRWLEVKDWGDKTATDAKALERLGTQVRAQDRIRQEMGLPVELILVMKYGLPKADYIRFKSELPYDNILFALPYGFDGVAR